MKIEKKHFRVVFKIDIGVADYLTPPMILTQDEIDAKLKEPYYSCVDSQVKALEAER